MQKEKKNFFKSSIRLIDTIIRNLPYDQSIRSYDILGTIIDTIIRYPPYDQSIDLTDRSVDFIRPDSQNQNFEHLRAFAAAAGGGDAIVLRTKSAETRQTRCCCRRSERSLRRRSMVESRGDPNVAECKALQSVVYWRQSIRFVCTVQRYVAPDGRKLPSTNDISPTVTNKPIVQYYR